MWLSGTYFGLQRDRDLLFLLHLETPDVELPAMHASMCTASGIQRLKKAVRGYLRQSSAIRLATGLRERIALVQFGAHTVCNAVLCTGLAPT